MKQGIPSQTVNLSPSRSHLHIMHHGLVGDLRICCNLTSEPMLGALTYTRRIRLNFPRTFRHHRLTDSTVYVSMKIGSKTRRRRNPITTHLSSSLYSHIQNRLTSIITDDAE
uniref:Uncharacterized protein n=1 Tax=Schistocephalus solidus TaxID=70667 RepID=A0A0X3PY74_SCHSO